MNAANLIDKLNQIVECKNEDLWFVATRANAELTQRRSCQLIPKLLKSKFYIPNNTELRFSVKEAYVYIHKLNSDKDFPYNKWRIPTLDEIRIIDFNHRNIFSHRYENTYIYNGSIEGFWTIDDYNNYFEYNFNSGNHWETNTNNRLLLICDEC